MAMGEGALPAKIYKQHTSIPRRQALTGDKMKRQTIRSINAPFSAQICTQIFHSLSECAGSGVSTEKVWTEQSCCGGATRVRNVQKRPANSMKVCRELVIPPASEKEESLPTSLTLLSITIDTVQGTPSIPDKNASSRRQSGNLRKCAIREI